MRSAVLALGSTHERPQPQQGHALATAKRYRQVEALLALMGQRRVEERLRSFLN